MTNPTDRDVRIAEWIKEIFAITAEKHIQRCHSNAMYGKEKPLPVSDLLTPAVQLLLLLAQKAFYITTKDDKPKILYALHDFGAYETLRSDLGRRTIDKLITTLAAKFESITMWHDLDMELLVLFAANTDGSQMFVECLPFEVRAILPALDDQGISTLINKKHEGQELVSNCVFKTE